MEGSGFGIHFYVGEKVRRGDTSRAPNLPLPPSTVIALNRSLGNVTHDYFAINHLCEYDVSCTDSKCWVRCGNHRPIKTLVDG
jgi:hypothetical protein